MPYPSASLATLRPELGSFMEFDLAMDRQGFIANRVLPVLEVAKQSGTFGKIPIEEVLKQRDTDRAPGAGYSRSDIKFETDTYACEEHGAEDPVDDRESQMYSEYFEAESFAALRARDIVLRNYEVRVASALFNATTFSPTSVTTEWSTIGSATPVTDVEGRVQALYDKGIKANALVIGWKAFRNLRRCTQVTDLIASSGAGESIKPSQVTLQQLREVFDLEHILVGDSLKQGAVEGAASSPAAIWDDEYAWVGRIANSNDIREVCIGRTFHWGEDGSQFGAVVESYRDETVRSQIVRSRMDTHEKLIHTDAGELLDNITA